MNTQKSLLIVGGANGSGKTTFASQYSLKHSLPFVNADEIAKRYEPEHFSQHRVKAGKIFFAEIEQHFATHSSFIIESTFSGKYLSKIIQKAREADYHITIAYLFLEHPKINVSRVRHRVLLGGHDIPEVDIIRRYYRSKKLFWSLYRDLADKWFIVYNGDSDFEEIANEEIVLNPYLYQEFLMGVDNGKN